MRRRRRRRRRIAALLDKPDKPNSIPCSSSF
jgi:hypothetical protein